MTSRRPEDGASTVEFALVVGVFLAFVGLALFAAHAHAVKSDLQRAADATAQYAATRRDPREVATTDPAWPDAPAVLAYANDQFGGSVDIEYAADQQACSVSGESPAVACIAYSPDAAATPTRNQQVDVRLRYRWETPFAPLLRVIGLGDTLVDLTGHGSAVVE